MPKVPKVMVGQAFQPAEQIDRLESLSHISLR
jgi:hypothetical protein